MFRTLVSLFLVGFVGLGWLRAGIAAEDKPKPMMKEWEQAVRAKIARDDKLKMLAAKYPLVLLHARVPYATGGYGHSAFSFIYESSEEEKHGNYVQIVWGNGGSIKNRFETNMLVGLKNLVADLGKVDFEKPPELQRITIDHPGLADYGIASEGHVYLERVREPDGNNFYVLFQVVAIDRDGRYMAFLWRKLPGGKIVKRDFMK